MKSRAGFWPKLALLAGAASLAIPTVAWAQDDRQTAAAFAAVGIFLLFIMMVLVLVGYIYHSLALSTIARKTNTENGWLAWIPIANLYLMTVIARKEWWWMLLCLVPLLNIVIIILLWMAIAEARQKPNWWGILIIVPLVGIIVPGYLAWSN